MLEKVTLLDQFCAENRCQYLDGDFFSMITAKVDCQIIRGVLHGFNDDQTGAILKNCHSALAANGKLLIVERIVESDNQPSMNKMMDILMMALLTGRERTIEIWDKLLFESGFKINSTFKKPSDFTIIEATKA